MDRSGRVVLLGVRTLLCTRATSWPWWAEGNAAVEGAVLLAKYATQVYLIYRGSEFFRPERIIVDELNRTATERHAAAGKRTWWSYRARTGLRESP